MADAIEQFNRPKTTMITRNKSRRGNAPNDENAIPQGKVTKKSLNTRSRAVLGDIENLNPAELPGKAALKSKQHPKCCLNAAIIAGLLGLRKTVLKLPRQMRADFYQFYKQRMEIRSEYLTANPLYFATLHNKLNPSDRVVDCAAQASFDYYQDIEYLVYPLPPSFLSDCVDLTPRMRYILVDWMVQVHQGYRLTTETLFLALRLLDRYVYLLGVTALHIASKFIEIFPPDISDYSSLTEGCFDATDIAMCEQMVLNGLNFLVNIPCPLFFLRRLSRSLGVDSLVHNLSKYFLELAFQEYELAHLSANFLSTWVQDRRRAGISANPRESRAASKRTFEATYEKYRSDDLFQRVAAMPELESPLRATGINFWNSLMLVFVAQSSLVRFVLAIQTPLSM
ncbi:G2/mitotic-specific cyclin-B2 [Taenia crassiceps]|uniref:G2/mitotic-specific cyclin-B2 n=1 Tax=Taenia crassiceps TaxID=6207 RepID=A0ABR4QMT7_9CEST